MEAVTLYHSAISHHCAKAEKVLRYKGIPYEIKWVPYHEHGPLVRDTGQEYVPYVVTSAGEGYAWNEIANWAEETVADPTLYPGSDPRMTRSIAAVVENWAHAVVEDAAWKYVVGKVPATIKDPDERWRFEETQFLKYGDLADMMRRRESLRPALESACALAEGMLGTRQFLLGDDPSLADFAVFGALHPLALVGESVPKPFDSLAQWMERVASI